MIIHFRRISTLGTLSVLVCLMWPVCGHCAENDRATVTAKKVKNWDRKGDGDPYTPTPEATPATSFEKPPNEGYDLIIVQTPLEYRKIAFQDVGAYMDPVDDGAIYNPQQQKGVFDILPVRVRVEGRKGIGTIYWVEVSLKGYPTGTVGITSAPTTTKPWWGGEVLGMRTGGLLVLKDMNTSLGTFDGETGEPDPVYFKAAADVKGDVEFWVTSGSGEYSWEITPGDNSNNVKLTSANNYKAPKNDLGVGTYTLKVTKGADFNREISFAVVAVSLYKKNAVWSADWVLKPTPDLFTLDRIAGIRIEGPGTGKEIKAKMWSSADPDPEHVATSHTNLAEDPSGSGVYRNTGTGRWPRFYWTWQPEMQRLKVDDEDGTLNVFPIIDGTDQVHLSVGQKVDLGEVSAIDATESDDAETFFDSMTEYGENKPSWGMGDSYYWSESSNREHITDDNCVKFGKKTDMLYVAGHGNSTKFVGVYGPRVQDNPEHPLGNHDKTPMDPRGFQPSDIGTEWANGELEWLVLAACSQLYMVTLGSPIPADYAVKWAEDTPKVHAILGYRGGCPSGPTDERIAARFANCTLTCTFVEAWLGVSRFEPDTGGAHTPWNVAVLVQLECVDDKWKDATKFPSPQTAETRYKFYWYDTDAGSATYGDRKETTFNLP